MPRTTSSRTVRRKQDMNSEIRKGKEREERRRKKEEEKDTHLFNPLFFYDIERNDPLSRTDLKSLARAELCYLTQWDTQRNTPLALRIVSGQCRSLKKSPCRHWDRLAGKVIIVTDGLRFGNSSTKCWGTWNATLGRRAKPITPSTFWRGEATRGSARHVHSKGREKAHRLSDQHWNSRGNTGKNFPDTRWNADGLFPIGAEIRTELNERIFHRSIAECDCQHSS